MDVKVFISHKEENKDYAVYVQNFLHHCGIKSFLDITDKGPNGYQSITDWIIENLRNSTHLLVIFSEHTKKINVDSFRIRCRV